MNELNPAIGQMAARHLQELVGAIDQAVKEGAGWDVILPLKAAARAYRQILNSRRPPPRRRAPCKPVGQGERKDIPASA